MRGSGPTMGRITGSASIETLVRVGIEKENGFRPDSKMVVIHDFMPCVDDELEVKRGQVSKRESGVVIVLRAKCFLCCRLLMFSTRRMTGFMLSARTPRRDLYPTVTAQLTARSRPR